MNELSQPEKSLPSEQNDINQKSPDSENNKNGIRVGNKGYISISQNKIALIALFISLISLLWTLYNSMNESNRWKAINMGDVEITDAFFIMEKALSKKEVISMNWGYEPFLIKEFDKEKQQYTDKLLLPYELIWYDIEKGEELPYSFGFFTIEEGLREIERIKEKLSNKKLDLIQVNYKIFKHYKIRFELRNTGSVPIDICGINIEIEDRDSGNKIPVSIDQIKFKLFPSIPRYIPVELYIPMGTKKYSYQTYHLAIEIIDAFKEKKNKKFSVIYDCINNLWSYYKK